MAVAVDPIDLVAYSTFPALRLPIVPAPLKREWMDTTLARSANHCLPLIMANQAGWFINNTHRIRVTWNGGSSRFDTTIECLEGQPPYPLISHFGNGIVSWIIPYIFRTSPGYNLLARGPANWPKDAAYPLDGLIETDWSVAPFTMNWQITAARRPVLFEVGEPICMLVPQRRGELEAVRPTIRDISTDADLRRGFLEWVRTRARTLDEIGRAASASRQGASAGLPWEQHYMRGRLPDGRRASEHQSRLALRPFGEESNLVGLPYTIEGTWGRDPVPILDRTSVEGPGKGENAD